MSVCHCQICIVWLTGAYASGVILVYGRPQVGSRTIDFPTVIFLSNFLSFSDKKFSRKNQEARK